MFCTQTCTIKEQSRNTETLQNNSKKTISKQRKQSAKMNSMSKVRFIGEEALPAEIESQLAEIDFSQVKKGPGCAGCYTIVFDTVCGHPWTFRKRCQGPGPVCAGSEIVFVHLQDIVLRRNGCTACRFLEIDNHRFKRTPKRKRGQPALTPEKLAAKMRLEEGREKWKRQCLESDIADRSRRSADHEVVDLTVEEEASE